MKIMTEEKAKLHLKLGRKLAIFVRLDNYFEQLTFDWILAEKIDADYKVALIRTLNEGDQIFNDVLSFTTINQIEEDFENSTNSFKGNLEECFSWIKSKFNFTQLNFIAIEDLKFIYTEYAKKGKFDIN